MVDRDVKLADDSLYVAKIGTDSVKEGQNVFKWLDEYMKKNNKTPRAGGDQFQVVVLEGTVGSSVAIRRQEGFKNAMAESADGVEIAVKCTCECDRIVIVYREKQNRHGYLSNHVF